MTPGRHPRGAALAVVLWALMALGTLALSAALAARMDLALGAAHRDHATALAAAEAGLAEALAALAGEPARAGAPDSLAGALGGGSWAAAWSPLAGGLEVRSTGSRGDARRTVVARVVAAAGAGLTVTAWKEAW